ncbi:MAG: hypothetical protein ABSE80_12185, partial [Halobacteriota archaeon]
RVAMAFPPRESVYILLPVGGRGHYASAGIGFKALEFSAGFQFRHLAYESGNALLALLSATTTYPFVPSLPEQERSSSLAAAAPSESAEIASPDMQSPPQSSPPESPRADTTVVMSTVQGCIPAESSAGHAHTKL